MCLAVPMKIKELDKNNVAVVESDGATARISVALIENPQVGEYVVIHAGYAIERIDTDEADKRLAFFREIAELETR